MAKNLDTVRRMILIWLLWALIIRNVCLFQIMFGGEKVGEGVGRTKKEAKYNAAESALLCLASMVQVIFYV